MSRSLSLPASVVVLVLLGSPLAHAVDGVLEINQTCAEQTGCFPGDAPGFPVEITVEGAYRLTSNLAPPTLAVDGITASVVVKIDLNGFDVKGPGTCSGFGATRNCTNGAGAGIRLVSGANVVGNGAVRFFGDDCIAMASGRLHDVLLASCGGSGVEATDAVALDGAQLLFNEGDGATLGRGSRATDVTTQGNRGHGLSLGASSQARDVSALSNGRAGIEGLAGGVQLERVAVDGNLNGINVGNASQVSHATAGFNTAIGIAMGAGARLSDSTATNNGSVGMQVGARSRVRDAVSNGNTTHGFLGLGGQIFYTGVSADLNGGSAIDSPVGGESILQSVALTGGTTISGPFTEFGLNSCNGSTTCP